MNQTNHPAGRCRPGRLLLTAGLLLALLAGCGAGPAENPPPEEDPPEVRQEEEAPALLTAQQAAQLPYTGDPARCVLSFDQAEAFAQRIEEAIADNPDAGAAAPFCRAALFDAGDGIPALWVAAGQHIYDNEYGYMPSLSRIYHWDGSQAALAMETMDHNFTGVTAKGLVTDDYKGWGAVQYAPCLLYPLSGGRVGGEPLQVCEYFGVRFPQGEPSAEGLQSAVEQYGRQDLTYDFAGAAGVQWQSPIEPLFEPWVIAALNGSFLSAEDAQRAWQDAAGTADGWLLGHGQGGHQDADWSWDGEWGDGGETAARLRSFRTQIGHVEDAGDAETAGDAGTGGEPQAAAPEGSTVSLDPSTHIQRTTLDPKGYALEIYFEIPVFEAPILNKDAGTYQKINAFFQGLQDRFFSPENEDLAAAWEMTAQNPPASYGGVQDVYTYCYNAQIYDWTDHLVSVTLNRSWYMGGVNDYGTECYTFSFDTGASLSLTDLIAGSEAELQQMIVQALFQDNPGLEEAYGDTVRSGVESRALKDFAFYVDGGRVHVTFPKYDLGLPGAAGGLEAVLPADLKIS